jgi:uncharacterized repeat protein (TIGR01451 family)
MKTNKNFLPGILLSSFLLLIFTLGITGNFLSKTFTTKNQEASVVKSIKVENIYNISPSKDFPGAFNFSYQFEKTRSSSKEVNFDLPIVPFDETKAGEFTDFGPIRDAWGYPVKENAFMKKEEPRKQSFLDSLKPNKAVAYDEDTSNPGVYNCRANTSITGYFKAYFEDVALNTNVGFDDPTFGDGRREEACQVLEDMSELLMMNTATVTPDILFTRSDQSLPPGALAAASSYFGYYSFSPDNGSLHKHIISRQNPTPAQGSFDAFVITNFNGINWSVDSSLNPNTYDFYSVMWHEMMHTLGFRALLPAVVPQTGVEHSHGTFDYHTYKDESLQNRFIEAITNLLNVPVGAPSPWFVTNQVVYRGIKNILNATPDGIRPIYSPTSWQQGSSLSHFDMNRAGGEEYVMHPSIGTNTEREIHEHEKEVLCHLGYMVEGMEGCEGVSPWANPDTVYVETSSLCINPLQNDSPMPTNLSIGTLSAIDLQLGDQVMYYPEADCLGQATTTVNGARSLQLIFDVDYATPVRLMEYSAQNDLSNRNSLLARIAIIPSCGDIVDPDEHVCNGGFEMAPFYENSVYPNAANAAFICAGNEFNPHIVPFWCGNGSSDLAEYDDAEASSWMLLPYDCSPVFGSGCEVNTPNNAGRAAVALNINGIFPPGSGHQSETLVTKLLAGLIAGEQYKLSFDVLTIASNANGSYPSLITSTFIIPGFDSGLNLGLSSPENITSTSPALDQVLPNQNVPFNVSTNTWTNVEVVFTANDDHDFLRLHGEHTGVGNQFLWFYFDNISVKKFSGDILNKITGTTYLDQNQNGSHDSLTEPRLSGIPVGLFQSGNSTPIQTTTTQDLPNLGKYEFTNLPDGEYYIGLIGENLYESVTQPGVSTDPFPSYNHMYTVTLGDDQTVEGLDFGVSLVGNVPQNTNIGIKKDLVDSSLTWYDRFITWRVYVSNQGLAEATNIQVSDVFPAGIVYYSQNPFGNISYNLNQGRVIVPSLAPNSYAYIDITTRVPSKACGKKTNTATLISLDQNDTQSSDNSGSKSIVLPPCPKPGAIFPSSPK